MSLGSPTVAFRLPQGALSALNTIARQRGISPGQLTRDIVLDRLVSDGLIANGGANVAPSSTPEMPVPATLAEQFRSGFRNGGKATEPASERLPYIHNRKLASSSRRETPNPPKPAPIPSRSGLFREGPNRIAAMPDPLPAATLNSPPKPRQPQRAIYLPGSPFAPKGQ